MLGTHITLEVLEPGWCFQMLSGYFSPNTINFSILKSVCWFGLIPQSKLGDLHFSLTVFKEEFCFYLNLFSQVF